MKKNIYFILLLGSIGLATHGCGSSGSSSTETINNKNNLLKGVSLLNSKQGQSGGFVDVDGDGIDDKVVGAPYAVKDSSIGVVLVYKGDGSGGYSSSPSLVLTGDDNLGYTFANLGDVDGDGKSDFAVGAISGDGDDVSLSGSVYIYKGGGSGQVIRKVAGDEAMDKFGLSLASGDLNDDGKIDIIVGAPFNSPSAALYQQGAVYVYLGPEFTTRITIAASSTNKGLGWSVAVGDINNDGKADLLISGSWPFSSTVTYQEVLGFYGGATFNPSINSYDVKVYSSATGFGKAIAALSDLNNDGYNEIAIGASAANGNTGSVYVINGGTGTRIIDLGATPVPTDQLVKINGVNLFDRFGSSLAVVPDMDDSDTIPELVVGATTANSDPNYLSGKVYLFKSANLSLPDKSWTSPSIFYGTTKDQSYGTFLAPAGNNKLLIGAPRSNMDTGGVSMVDLASGQIVAGGSSGGGGGEGGDCH